VLEKGSVVEFGVYGVYVCTGCGYAYHPELPPASCDLDERNQRFRESAEEDNDDEPLDAEMQSMTWWAYYGLVDDQMRTLLLDFKKQERRARKEGRTV
jgi:hypothetical protein